MALNLNYYFSGSLRRMIKLIQGSFCFIFLYLCIPDLSILCSLSIPIVPYKYRDSKGKFRSPN